MRDRTRLPTSGLCAWPETWLVAAAALFAAGVPPVAVGSDDPAPSVEEWPARCEALREDFSAHPGLDVLLSERPERGVGSDQVWILEWQGVALPVPKADYDSLELRLPAADGQADASLMLHGPSGVAVGAFVFPMFEPMDDAFATLGPSGAVRESLGGQDLSQALWGRPVSMAELERRGYQTTPDDLACTRAAWRELLDAMEQADFDQRSRKRISRTIERRFDQRP